MLPHIGVSNFGTHDLASLARVAETRPATLQVKFNPFHQGRTGNAAAEDLAAAALQGGTTVVGYCPLNDWPSKLAPIDDAIVAHVARSYARTPAQVLLRWGLQRGVAVLTRSRSEARLREALGAHTFRLSNADMALLSGLAWLLAAPANRPPGSVLDVLGVAEADEWAREAAAAKEEL